MISLLLEVKQLKHKVKSLIQGSKTKNQQHWDLNLRQSGSEPAILTHYPTLLLPRWESGGVSNSSHEGMTGLARPRQASILLILRLTWPELSSQQLWKDTHLKGKKPLFQQMGSD